MTGELIKCYLFSRLPTETLLKHINVLHNLSFDLVLKRECDFDQQFWLNPTLYIVIYF